MFAWPRPLPSIAFGFALQNQTGDPCLGLDGRPGHRGHARRAKVEGQRSRASMAGPAIEGKGSKDIKQTSCLILFFCIKLNTDNTQN